MALAPTACEMNGSTEAIQSDFPPAAAGATCTRELSLNDAARCRAPGGPALLVARGLRRRVTVAVCSALCLMGCSNASDESAGETDGQAECSGDFDTFMAGMTKRALPGDLTIELEQSDPSPPAVRQDNVWWLRLSDSEGTQVTGAALLVTPYMPKHQHGSAEVVVEELGDGRYKLSSIQLIMPGVWEVPVSVTPAEGDTSEATFSFCIAER